MHAAVTAGDDDRAVVRFRVVEYLLFQTADAGAFDDVDLQTASGQQFPDLGGEFAGSAAAGDRVQKQGGERA